MTTFLLIDANHLINRAKHSFNGDATIQSGMALNIIFFSIKKLWEEFAADHIVFCFDGRSWRKELFPEYKLKREVDKAAKTLEEKENDDYFWGVMREFEEFISKRTNCTVLHSNGIEADDFIARFIDLHPNDEHIIVSSDNDFIQLIDDNVSIYNGINEVYIRKDGVYDSKGRPVFFKFKNDGKVSIPKKVPKDAEIPTLNEDWIEQSLFFKVLRGDVSDGIFTAVEPGTRQTKIVEAFEDRKDKGYLWNNLMLQSWEDHNGESKRVIDRFNFNRSLIDLRSQPQEIIDAMDKIIVEEITIAERKKQIGIWLMKFFNKHDLNRLENHVKAISECFSSAYPVDDIKGE